MEMRFLVNVVLVLLAFYTSTSSSVPLIKCNQGSDCLVFSVTEENDENAKMHSDKFTPPCPSEIYCYGPLLHTVQMSGIYSDSKTFVDMKMLTTPEETLSKFETFMTNHDQKPSNTDLKQWVESNFAPPGSEFEHWIPNDWHETPKFVERIKDEGFRQFASALNKLWLELGRKMTKDVKENTNRYSIIHVDYPVIVPGGRFREFYYWDSYWILRGLLLSEMAHTAKGMLLNFRSIIQRFGFIPNGGRIYYSARSQPPMLAAMIKSYVDATHDEAFAIESADDLAHEFHFWMNNHTLSVHGHSLAVYGDKSSGPRPESYREDVETSAILETDEEKEDYYSELKAGAESGMDFTSRFFIRDGTNKGDLRDLKTRSIVAVDLNAILQWNAKIIAEFYRKGNNLEKAEYFENEAAKLLEAINKVLWHDDIGAWLDYDIINDKRREYFTPTNLYPLWTRSFNPENENTIAEKVLKYIADNGLDSYAGGVPNTFEQTGEQWDYPNVWPPMQHALIMGLDNLNNAEAKELAFRWAERWVRSNYMAYEETKNMFEKYNALELGGHGGGGEYEIQIGFGWTNGVVMELLDKYGDRFTSQGTE